MHSCATLSEDFDDFTVDLFAEDLQHERRKTWKRRLRMESPVKHDTTGLSFVFAVLPHVSLPRSTSDCQGGEGFRRRKFARRFRRRTRTSITGPGAKHSSNIVLLKRHALEPTFPFYLCAMFIFSTNRLPCVQYVDAKVSDILVAVDISMAALNCHICTG